MGTLSTILNPSVVRSLKLFAIADTLGVILTGGISLPDSNALYHMVIADASAQVKASTVTAIAPEMPLALVPVLIVMTVTSLYYIRKNLLLSARA